MICPFTYLGLMTSASKEEVTKAYRVLAMKCHPDRGGSHEKFVELDKQYKLALSQVGGVTSRDVYKGIFSEFYNRTYSSEYKNWFGGDAAKQQEWWNKEQEELKRKAKEHAQRQTKDPARQKAEEEQEFAREWQRTYAPKMKPNKDGTCTACDGVGYIDINNGVKTLRMRCPACLKGE